MITLQEIAPYLPYGIHMKSRTFSRRNPDILILTIQNLPHLMSLNRLPILQPLSDLTKEIEVNGEKFVPINVLKSSLNYPSLILISFNESYGSAEIDFDQNISKLLPSVGFCIFQKLFEWHFDIFGLISRGDAIDINTLNK